MAGPSRVNLPIHLILDFDGTITRKDTMHLLADIGYSHQSANGRVPQPTPWSEIVDAYMTDFKAHANSYTPKAVDRTSPEQETAWLGSLERVEEASFQRVLAAGIFDGVSKDEVERAGKVALQEGKLQLRSGLQELVVQVRRHNATCSDLQLPIRVLSVNWSASFIRGVIQQGSEDHQMEKPLIHPQHIYANELPSITKEDTSPSIQTPPLRTSTDKGRLLQQLRQTTDGKGNSLLIYIGDSSTDLDCLLTADIGVVVQDDPMGSGQKESAETCQRIGIGIHPIREAGPGRLGSDGGKTLWSVREFDEVAAWIGRGGGG